MFFSYFLLTLCLARPWNICCILWYCPFCASLRQLVILAWRCAVEMKFTCLLTKRLSTLKCATLLLLSVIKVSAGPQELLQCHKPNNNEVMTQVKRSLWLWISSLRYQGLQKIICWFGRKCCCLICVCQKHAIQCSAVAVVKVFRLLIADDSYFTSYIVLSILSVLMGCLYLH